MARKNDGGLKLADVSLEEFLLTVEANGREGNQFSRTFVAKANLQDLWPALGAWKGSTLAGAVAWTLSRKGVANLQLLHVFADYRRLGIGRLLCQAVLGRARKAGAGYFRVSAERSAVAFYERLGIRFLGRQKSGCSLSIGRISGETFRRLTYDLADDVIRAAVYRKGKGGCVEVYEKTPAE